MGMQQPYYGQQQQQAGGWGQPQNPNSLLPPPLNPGAPADPETLKRLKEELLQQKQAAAPGKFGAAAAGRSRQKKPRHAVHRCVLSCLGGGSGAGSAVSAFPGLQQDVQSASPTVLQWVGLGWCQQ